MAIFDLEIFVVSVALLALACWVIQRVLPNNPDLKKQKS